MKDSEKVGIVAISLVIIGSLWCLLAVIIRGNIPSAMFFIGIDIAILYIGMGIGMALTDVYIYRLEKKIPPIPPPLT
jgi:pilus assembly protein TadC